MNCLKLIPLEEKQHKRIQIYSLLFLVSLIYLRSIFGEFISLDDDGLAKHLAAWTDVNFAGLFFGERGGVLYYRPLLVSTYYLEKIFLSVDPRIMRLDNVLLQLANTCLVFLIIDKIYSLKNRPSTYWPLLFALLFGLHPLATESINWISGRTDLLAGFFVLVATLLVLEYRLSQSVIILFTAFLSAFCAILSKEVAVAFVPGLFMLWCANYSGNHSQSWFKGRLWRVAGIGFGITSGIVALAYLRSLLITENHGGISRTIHMMTDDLVYSAMLFFRLFGFYAKKMIAPWPLNLAIVEVDPLYDFLGVLIVLLLLWLFVWNRFSGDFFIIAGLLLVPAYPISFGQIAWTVYAERYAYVALAFVLFGFAALAADYLSAVRHQKVVGFALIVLLIPFAATTFLRNGIWQSSLTLWEDTVQKSPHSVDARNGYGLALYYAGDWGGAKEQLDLARAGFGYKYSPHRDRIYGQLLFVSGSYAEAITAWREAFIKTDRQSVEILSEVVTECSRSKHMTQVCGGYETVSAEFSDLYVLSEDPVWLFKWADFSDQSGHKEQALNLYRQAKSMLPASHPLQSGIRERLDNDL